MRTLQRVFNQIAKSKVNLEKHNVELGAIEDIGKLVNNARAGSEDAGLSLQMGVDKVLKQATAEITKGEKVYNSAKKKINEVKSQLKNLGVEFPSELISLEKANEDWGQTFASYRQMIKAIRSAQR